MTGRGLPAFIDPFRLAAAGGRLNGRLPLAIMRRLGEALLDQSGEVRVALQFDRHQDCHGQVVGQVEARVRMRCQRCLRPAELELLVPVSLGVVRSESEAERLPHELEPLLVGDDRYRLSDLVEDELLLALPVVPMHSENATECVPGTMEFKSEGATESGAADTERPFDVLAALKKQQ
ncbi:YceD family protein [Methylonatrum kenyense]|uniref:YceD family protein n=1 Tax=Methylonatrum kenyense TaxID=455253 RepID=UPI0020BF3C34|nr:YceD family protein [Methylonatrum kenyense]MCK8516490.1 YceD family protein [Methylonatrum kenyense]